MKFVETMHAMIVLVLMPSTGMQGSCWWSTFGKAAASDQSIATPHLWHFGWSDGGKHKDHSANVNSLGRNFSCQVIICDVCYKGMHAPTAVLWVRLH